MRRLLILILITLSCNITLKSQEITAKVSVNHSQVGNTTRTDVFESLQQKVTAFLNEHAWTSLQFRESERISCSMSITVNTYNDTENMLKCAMQLTVSRPVFNSNYTTTTYFVKDNAFDFTFQPTDQLEFAGANNLDNNLVALLSYYAYMIIGYDMDSMSPLGGTPYFNIAEDICNSAENLGFTGWRAFGDSKNRFGLLNDLMDGSMECFRQLTYKYHREGLDQMAENTETARETITEALDLLDAAKQAKSMSQLPLLFTEFKRDELVNIYTGKGTSEERSRVYDILFNIDPSQSNSWDQIKK